MLRSTRPLFFTLLTMCICMAGVFVSPSFAFTDYCEPEYGVCVQACYDQYSSCLPDCWWIYRYCVDTDCGLPYYCCQQVQNGCPDQVSCAFCAGCNGYPTCQ